VNGSVSLYPTPSGWAKTSVNGLELAALAGPAKKFDVTLRSGTYDSEFEFRLKDQTVTPTGRLSYTDLSASEPPGGPIGKHFSPPGRAMDLDGIITVLKRPDNSIVLPVAPVDVPLKKGEPFPFGEVYGSVAGAVTSAITIGVASVPLKAVNAVGEQVGSWLGIPKDKKPDNNGPFAIDFAPGAVSASDAQEAEVLKPIFARMRDNPDLTLTVRHELGGADVQRASARANPSPEDCRNLEYRLRARKAELLRERADAAGAARAQLVSLGEGGASASLARLRAIDQELGQTENALDQVLELLRPGADRQAARRTRQASLAVARERLEAVKAYLLASSNVHNIASRLSVVEAQYNPAEGTDGGHVWITVVQKK
jgi:hypothetical protein